MSTCIAPDQTLKRTTEALSCPVCRRLFKSPKYLSCYHFYCEECLVKIMEDSKIACPECRKETMVPAGGVKSLQNNFFINQLVDQLILKTNHLKCEEKQKPVKCDNCEHDDPVVALCPDCSHFLCQVCKEYHMKRPCTSHGHGIIGLTDISSNNRTLLQTMPRSAMKEVQCKEHENEIAYYCETCKDLVCFYCTVKTHNGHNYNSLKRTTNEYKRKLKENTTAIDMMIQTLSETYENFKSTMDNLKKQGREAKNQINSYYDELYQQLMDQKQHKMEEVNCKIAAIEKSSVEHLGEIQIMLTQLNQLKVLNDSVKKSTDQQMVLSSKKELTDQMKQLTSRFEKLNPRQSMLTSSLQFYPTKMSLPQFGELLFHVDPLQSELSNPKPCAFVGVNADFSLVTRYGNGVCYPKGGSQVSVRLESSEGTKTTVQVKDNNDGSYNISFLPQHLGVLKMFVTINGQQIKGSPYNISVCKNYPAMRAPCNIVNSGGKMGKPWGIAFANNGAWAVADNLNHCVHVFDKDGQLLWKIGSKGKHKNQLDGPCGIAFDENNHLYIADCNNHRIVKFDIGGNYLLHFGQHGGIQLHSPVGITVHGNNVFVADSNLNCIVKYQTNGQYCQVIGRGLLDNPHGVVVNKNNQLLTTDCGHNCIRIFTLLGEYMGNYGTKKLSGPRSLTINEDGFVLVTDTGNHRVLVYSKDGTCVHQFGSKGTGNAQFLNPRGVAIGTDGNSYVCDSLNCCIKIFSCESA